MMKIGRVQKAQQYVTLAVYCILATVGAFTGGMWAIGGIGLSVVLFLSTWFDEKHLPQPDKTQLGFAVVALVVMAALNFGSAYPQVSWRVWLNLITIFLPLTLLTSPALQARVLTPNMMRVVVLALVVGALALGVELHLGGALLHLLKGQQAPLTEYNRSMAFLVMLAFPCMAWLWQVREGGISGRWLVVLFLFALLFPAGLTESRTAKLALMVGVAIALIAAYLPTITRRALAAGVVVLAGWSFAARWFFLNHFDALAKLPPSWRARMEIWDYISYRIAEHPWLGWGLGVTHKLDFTQPHGASYVYTVVPASHPHNVLTELWVELGVSGLVLGFVFAWLVLRKISRLDARYAPFAYGAFAAALCINLVGFDFWSDAIFATYALTGFAFALLQQPVADKTLAD